MPSYNPKTVEPRWQRYWLEHKTFRTPDESSRPKFYILDMFPYPSGAGLHVGHPEGYTATDILARYRRMNGYNVLHPMGWDAFGLPAEQYAIETGTHPRETTQRNIDTFRRQIQMLGFSYDWDREVDTTDPNSAMTPASSFAKATCSTARACATPLRDAQVYFTARASFREIPMTPKRCIACTSTARRPSSTRRKKLACIASCTFRRAGRSR